MNVYRLDYYEKGTDLKIRTVEVLALDTENAREKADAYLMALNKCPVGSVINTVLLAKNVLL